MIADDWTAEGARRVLAAALVSDVATALALPIPRKSWPDEWDDLEVGQHFECVSDVQNPISGRIVRVPFFGTVRPPHHPLRTNQMTVVRARVFCCLLGKRNYRTLSVHLSRIVRLLTKAEWQLLAGD